MKLLRYICCQPAETYFIWQIEVLINNFKKMGVNPNMIDIVCSYDEVIPPEWLKMQQYYNTVRFFFYPDTRDWRGYQPSIYFHLMKKHLAANPDLQTRPLFLHDSDIIFTRPPQFQEMASDDVWYLSDTNSYINYDYINSKKREGTETQLEDMCAIVGVNPDVVKANNNHSGGAQYLVKNVTPEFFDKVESDAIKLYNYMALKESSWIKRHENDHVIQKWTAGMWSILWNAWYFGHTTIVDERMGFGWVTNAMSDVEKYSILHNAGVVHKTEGLFYKLDYRFKLPYNEQLTLDKSKASWYYWQEVQETANKSILL